MLEVFEFGGRQRVAEVCLFDDGVWRAIVDGSHVLFFEWDRFSSVSFSDCLLDAWIAEGLNV